jgi:hypothetical protein
LQLRCLWSEAVRSRLFISQLHTDPRLSGILISKILISSFRSAIEEELEVLYDAYYEELEQYANYQQRYVSSGGTIPPPPGPGPFPGSVEVDKNGAVIGHPKPAQQHQHPPAARTKSAVFPNPPAPPHTTPATATIPAPPAAVAPTPNANINGRKSAPGKHIPAPAPAPLPESEFDDDEGEDEEYEDEEEYEEEEDDEDEDDEEEEGEGEEEEDTKAQRGRRTAPPGNNKPRAARRPAPAAGGPKANGREGLFNLGTSLTVTGKSSSHVFSSLSHVVPTNQASRAGPGNILTVADDLLKNDGQKFLEMMEQLAERRMQREEEAAADVEDDSEEEDEEDEDEEDEDDEDGDEDEEDEEEVMHQRPCVFL